ncbi:hypothetical protein [Microcoleus sp. FACHB-68]|uniref:hypothetical protein n=1 Tax=Microcoleus sp. FACHB-68 TaxID=2692826 RepID=UPI0016832B2C|nr:hypothetical protein [Microcoleus sp. FACHB-68]MBD1938242.1 hypothetical protein [Microcoleus sp. FACHB-68]
MKLKRRAGSAGPANEDSGENRESANLSSVAAGRNSLGALLTNFVLKLPGIGQSS